VKERDLNIAVKSDAATPVTGAAAQFLEHYRAAFAHLPGDSRAREAAASLLTERGLPNRRVEAWKYTDLRALLRYAPPPALNAPEIAQDALQSALGALAGLSGPRLVFVNGHFVSGLSHLAGMEGVEFTPLRQGLANMPAWAASMADGPDADAVNTINAMFAADGAMLHIAPGVKLAEPLQLAFIAAGDEPSLAAPRNLIAAGEGAEAIIVESFVSLGTTGSQIYASTRIAAGKDSRIGHVKFAGENLQSQHFCNWHVSLGEAAEYNAVQIASGASLSRHQIFLNFEGEGARGHFAGAQLLRGRQHCDVTMVIDHAVPRCESRELMRAVLDGEARGVFQGKVIVRRDAQKTDGQQMARALLLSDAAEFDAKPELEIYADDVKCNHGSAIGRLDRNMLFYLRSRGIPEPQARAMLIGAFVNEVVDAIAHDALREAASAHIAVWLEAQEGR
jgi:Fe-S cluster assembly protein SufD